MAANLSDIERAVARTLRDSLEKLQHTSDEVGQAVGDLVSACGSARPSNALPHLVRAQTAAASLAASLDVLSRFITGALQPGWNAANSESQASPDEAPLSAQNKEQYEMEEVAQEKLHISNSGTLTDSAEAEAPLVDSSPAEHIELVVEADEEGSVKDWGASPISVDVSQSAAELLESVPEIASSAQFHQAAAAQGELSVEMPTLGISIEEPLGTPSTGGQENGGHLAENPEALTEMQPSGSDHMEAAPEFEPPPEQVASILETVVCETAAAETNTAEELPAGAASSEPPVASEVAVETVTSFAVPATPFSIPATPSQPLPTEPAIQPRLAAEHPMFDVAALPAEQQELHRRANRVAKVTMQDIKMLRPRDVELGKQNHDLCTRLRDDIERARKEYERRFQAILEHPVDYFHVWMVEILADGEEHALGQYPYRSPVLQR
jgi:hypothetical protein